MLHIIISSADVEGKRLHGRFVATLAGRQLCTSREPLLAVSRILLAEGVMLIRHPDPARGYDLYETPEVATLALLRAEPLPRTTWEPACGPGAIVRVLRDADHRVIATDLFDYHSPDQDYAGRDFLLDRRAPDGVEMIVTNPPFKLAAQFAAHALSLCPRVAMLLRLSILESGNEKTKAGRARLFALDGGHLARVFVFIDRLPMKCTATVGPEIVLRIPWHSPGSFWSAW